MEMKLPLMMTFRYFNLRVRLQNGFFLQAHLISEVQKRTNYPFMMMLTNIQRQILS